MAIWVSGQVGLYFIPHCEPWRNGYVEPLNSRLRERLLVEALIEELDELDARIAPDGPQPPRWRALIDSYLSDKALWTSHLEAIVAAQRNDELRIRLAEGQRRARTDMGGSIPLANLIGLMIQSLIDPESAPTAEQAIAEMRELATRRTDATPRPRR